MCEARSGDTNDKTILNSRIHSSIALFLLFLSILFRGGGRISQKIIRRETGKRRINDEYRERDHNSWNKNMIKIKKGEKGLPGREGRWRRRGRGRQWTQKARSDRQAAAGEARQATRSATAPAALATAAGSPSAVVAAMGGISKDMRIRIISYGWDTQRYEDKND